jgi:dolichyl-phosphate-mannose-protein mannosyltransferase
MAEDDKATRQSTPDPLIQVPKTSEWDYKLGLVVVTILAFLTRFYLISHPKEVVFDEVHFGKVQPPRSRVFRR